MMATPADLEDFAYGFSFTEGVIAHRDEIRGVEVRLDADAARIDVALAGERMHALLARRRAMPGRTGCGVCGIEDLAHLPRARRVSGRSRRRAAAPSAPPSPRSTRISRSTR